MPVAQGVAKITGRFSFYGLSNTTLLHRNLHTEQTLVFSGSINTAARVTAADGDLVWYADGNDLIGYHRLSAQTTRVQKPRPSQHRPQRRAGPAPRHR